MTNDTPLLRSLPRACTEPQPQPRIDLDLSQEAIAYIQALADEKGISLHDMTMLIVEERIKQDKPRYTTSA